MEREREGAGGIVSRKAWPTDGERLEESIGMAEVEKSIEMVEMKECIRQVGFGDGKFEKKVNKTMFADLAGCKGCDSDRNGYDEANGAV